MDFNPPLLRVLILGSGGREHALAWKIAQSTLVEKVYVAPGNAGTKSKDDKFVAVPIPVTDFRKLVEYAVQNEVRLSLMCGEITFATLICRAIGELGRCRTRATVGGWDRAMVS